MPLITCPTCASGLIYPLDSEPFGDAHRLIERRCPECEHGDRVVVSTVAAMMWERSQQRRTVELAAELLMLELTAWLDARADLAPGAS
jgi:hypothetical protein